MRKPSGPTRKAKAVAKAARGYARKAVPMHPAGRKITRVAVDELTPVVSRRYKAVAQVELLNGDRYIVDVYGPNKREAIRECRRQLTSMGDGAAGRVVLEEGGKETMIFQARFEDGRVVVEEL